MGSEAAIGGDGCRDTNSAFFAAISSTPHLDACFPLLAVGDKNLPAFEFKCMCKLQQQKERLLSAVVNSSAPAAAILRAAPPAACGWGYKQADSSRAKVLRGRPGGPGGPRWAGIPAGVASACCCVCSRGNGVLLCHKRLAVDRGGWGHHSLRGGE
jgi:hypothetical protein